MKPKPRTGHYRVCNEGAFRANDNKSRYDKEKYLEKLFVKLISARKLQKKKLARENN